MEIMDYPIAFDTDYSVIDSYLQPSAQPQSPPPRTPWRAVTISRHTGCGALAVAEKLAALLQQNNFPLQYPWKIFDRNLMEKVLEDHRLPTRLAQYLPEDRIGEVR